MILTTSYNHSSPFSASCKLRIAPFSLIKFKTRNFSTEASEESSRVAEASNDDEGIEHTLNRPILSPSMYDLDLNLTSEISLRTEDVEAFLSQIIDESKTCTYDIFRSRKFYRIDELEVKGVSMQSDMRVGGPICLQVTTRNSNIQDLYSILTEIFEHISQKYSSSDMPIELWSLSYAWNNMIYNLTRTKTFRKYLELIASGGFNRRKNGLAEEYDFATAYVRMVSSLKLILKKLHSDITTARFCSQNFITLPCIKISDLVCYEKIYGDIKPTSHIPLDL